MKDHLNSPDHATPTYVQYGQIGLNGEVVLLPVDQVCHKEHVSATMACLVTMVVKVTVLRNDFATQGLALVGQNGVNSAPVANHAVMAFTLILVYVSTECQVMQDVKEMPLYLSCAIKELVHTGVIGLTGHHAIVHAVAEPGLASDAA